MTFEFRYLTAAQIQPASILRSGYPGQALWDDCVKISQCIEGFKKCVVLATSKASLSSAAVPPDFHAYEYGGLRL